MQVWSPKINSPISQSSTARAAQGGKGVGVEAQKSCGGVVRKGTSHWVHAPSPTPSARHPPAPHPHAHAHVKPQTRVQRAKTPPPAPLSTPMVGRDGVGLKMARECAL